MGNFYPRPPRGGRHQRLVQVRRQPHISIHALREEGDILCPVNSAEACHISIHALREEGDPEAEPLEEVDAEISIHALREEGDCVVYAPPDSADISIHALREEGD